MTDVNVPEKDVNETETDDNETVTDDNETETDDNETETDGNETETDGNETEKDDNKTETNVNETETDGNETEMDGNEMEKDGIRTMSDVRMTHGQGGACLLTSLHPNRPIPSISQSSAGGHRARRSLELPSRLQVVHKNTMKTLFLLFISSLALHAAPDDFRENFADPATRPAALAMLTPGTRDFFFHTALDHQLNARANEYAATIAAWKLAAEDKKKRVSTKGLTILENRRILLTYDTDPKDALIELTETLGLKFDATKPDSAATNKALPTSLDPALVAPAAFRKAAEIANPREPYINFSDRLLYREMDKLETFSEARLRWFAQKFDRHDHPRYTEMVAKALALKDPVPSGDFSFSGLTLAQLDELKKSTPSLLSNERFNTDYLRKLTPAYPPKLVRHPAEHAAFLAACKDYAATLPPSQNSLKAHVLYHHLRLQEILGNHPKEDFLAYLALPRSSHPIILPVKASKAFVSTGQDYSATTQCPTVRDDSALIESYLFHFLKESDTAQKPFIPLIQEKRLALLHARARLLAGADPTRWATALKPEEYKTLREETRITFAPSAPQLFGAGENASLPLDLKNTAELLIRIYELEGAEGDSPSIDLDGLVPHKTRTISFEQAPLVLHRESIDLPELTGAGQWIVEFVSNQISARALVRKGNITPHVTRTAAGQTIRLFDEKSQPLAEFSLELGSETFTAKDGTLTVPDAANQPVTSGTLTAGKLSTEISLGSRSEALSLESSFLLDREQLLADLTTTLHLRTRLTNHGHEIPLNRIESPVLVLKAKLLGGITTERIIADPLPLATTNQIPILIPADLLSLTLTLSGTVTSATSGETETLSASETFQLNGALETDRIATALFSPTSTGHRLFLRGRNGEPLANRPVNLKISHELYRKSITTNLRTDASGLIDLGALTGITHVAASSSDIATTSYFPPSRDFDIPQEITIPANTELRVPLKTPAGKPDPARVQFYRVISSTGNRIDLIENLLSTATVADNRHLVIKDLAPGDYYLLQDQDTETEITVLPADSVRNGLLVTEDSILPLHHPATPTVSSTNIAGGTLTIRLAGASPETRVTVIGKRYHFHKWESGYAPYPFEPQTPESLTRAVRPSSYLTERRLSDEMRYILDRRNATTFPGSMLPRPGQLLYRWTPDDLDQETQTGRDQFDGGILPPIDDGGDRRPAPAPKRRSRDSDSTHPAVIDFLAHTSAVKFSLTPDADGKLEIPLADLEGSQFIEIITADLSSSETTFIPLPPNETPLRDRRLARPLAPDTHHLATRFAAALATGAEANIENLLDADWRAFTTLAEAHQFLLATTGDDRLQTFTFLTTWPDLEEKEKLALLAEHHCHELHLFLSRKDPDFFAKHVKPFLIAKPEPQFIDDYLLARDLTKYLRPYAFSRLNAAEKALLAQALPARKTDISRELDIRWKTEAPTPDAETILFSQTLKGADLTPTDSLGLARNLPGLRGLITAGNRSGDSAINRNNIDAILNNPNRVNSANVDKVRRTLYMAQGNYDLGKYDAAKANYEDVLRLDPYNSAARRGMEKIAATKSDYYRAAYDHTRAELLNQVDNAWELSAPEETNGVAYITEKLNRIIIPRIDFEDTTVEEAIDFLRLRTTELDSLELDPNKKGISFVIRRPRNASTNAPPDGDLLGGGDPGSLRIKSLKLRNVPLSVALKYIGDATKLRYKVDDYAVTLVPQTETGEDLFTRTFRVPPDFRSLLSTDPIPSDMDPFADTGGGSGGALAARAPIKDLLRQAGIIFPDGTSVTLGANGTLLVTNTPSELDKIEQLTDTFGTYDPAREDEMRKKGEQFAPSYDNPVGTDPFAAQTPRPRLFPDRTRLWLDSNYYKHRGSTGEALIPLNRFWLELSAWDGKGPFTSPHFNACTNSAADALMCLAMLDLPFKAEKPEVTVEESTLKVKARAPMLLFYKDTRRTENVAPESPLLVRQSYHPLAEPFRNDEQDRKIENTVTGEFRTGVPYGLSMVITNPTGTERRIETLAQIPAGAIPLASSIEQSLIGDGILPPLQHTKHAPETLSTSHKLEPYGVVQLQLAFYFPAPGDYPAYPLHVSEGEQILAHAQPRTLRVSADPAPEDSASWLVIARDGTDEAVLNRLSTADLSSTNLSAIHWRLRDKEFFLKATAILRERLRNEPDVFAFSVLHNDPATLTDFIENTPLAKNLGQWFSSKLISIDPVTYHGWETMEFDPLVNARAHPFGENPRLTHEQARQHYEAFLDTLQWKPALTSADELTFTYYLFLQDRIAEALARFAKIKPADLPDPLQYDYLRAVALFYEAKPEEAKAIAEGYVKKLPPGTWLERFQAVATQAEEIAKPVPAMAEEKGDTQASLEISQLPDGKLLLKHANLEETTLSLYHIDLEVLFSKDPFLKGGVESSLPPISPNETTTIAFQKGNNETPYELPENFRQGNILVAAESEEAKQLKILDSRLLETRIVPVERTIQVIDPTTNKPLPATYIKVFAESRDGSTTFHKDGYTDLRGKFDYLSHTGTDPATIRRLAILVSHPEKGSLTRITER